MGDLGRVKVLSKSSKRVEVGRQDSLADLRVVTGCERVYVVHCKILGSEVSEDVQ